MTNRSKQQFLAAAVTSLFLAVSLAGCGGSSGSVDAENLADQLGPGEVAMLYVEALSGNPEALQEYNPSSSITFEQSVPASFNESFLMESEVTPTTAEIDALNEAGVKALDKIKMSVISEEINGDNATVLLTIQGLDFETALDATFSASEVAPTAGDQELIVALLLESWQTAELGEGVQELELIFKKSMESGADAKWFAQVPESGDIPIPEVMLYNSPSN